MINKIRCCYNCQKRHIGCHSDCKDYLAEKAARDAEISLISKQRAIDDMFISRKAKQATESSRRKNIRRG